MNELNEIARQHPESVAFLFNQYGYAQLPLTGVSIQAMAIKFGHDFLTELAEKITEDSQLSGFAFSNIFPKRGTVENISNPKVVKSSRNTTGRVSNLKTVQPRLQSAITVPKTTIDLGKITIPASVGNLRPTTITANAPEKKSGFFNNLLGILERGAGVYAGIKAAGGQQQQRQMEQQMVERKRSNTALIVGAVVVILLLGGLLLFNGKKTIK